MESPEPPYETPASSHIPGIDVPPPHGWQPEPSGSPASFFWLARYFVMTVQNRGLRIDKQCLDYLAELLKSPHP